MSGTMEFAFHTLVETRLYTSIRKAELHRYEAHGIGKKKMKIKRFLD